MKKLLILFFAFFLVSCQSQTGKDGGVFIETSQKMAVIGDTVYFLSVNDGVCCFREGKVTTLLSEERLFLSRLFIYDGTVYAAGMDRREDSDTDGHFVLYRKGETGFELLLATTDILDADILCGMVDGVFYGYSRSPAQHDVLFTCNLKNGKWKENSGFLGRDFSVSYSEHTMFYQGKVAAFGKFRDKETEFSVKRQKIFCPLSELTLSAPWMSTISGRYDGYFMKDGAVSIEESVFYDFDTGKEIPLSFPVDEQLMGMVSRDEGVLLFTKEANWGYSNEKNRYQIYEVTKDGVFLQTDSAFLWTYSPFSPSLCASEHFLLITTEEKLENAVFIGEETSLSTDVQGMTSYATLPTYYQYLYDLESGALFCVFVGQAA